jgi:hypothetical protein
MLTTLAELQKSEIMQSRYKSCYKVPTVRPHSGGFQ